MGELEGLYYEERQKHVCARVCACICTCRAVRKHPSRLLNPGLESALVTAVRVAIKLSNHFWPEFALSWHCLPM